MKFLIILAALFCFNAHAILSPITSGAGGGTITSYAAYTPTLTGFGTPTNVDFEWRRVGNAYDIHGCFTSDTPTATEARISLPGGASVAAISSIRNFGNWTQDAFITGNGHILAEPSVAYLTFGYEHASGAGLTKVNGSGIITAGVKMCVHVSGVPIAGL